MPSGRAGGTEPVPLCSDPAPQHPQLSRVGDQLRAAGRSDRLGGTPAARRYRSAADPGAEVGPATRSSPWSWHPARGERGGGQRDATGLRAALPFPPGPVPVGAAAARGCSLSPARCRVPRGPDRGAGGSCSPAARSGLGSAALSGSPCCGHRCSGPAPRGHRAGPLLSQAAAPLAAPPEPRSPSSVSATRAAAPLRPRARHRLCPTARAAAAPLPGPRSALPGAAPAALVGHSPL